jgi:acetylornithine deacetylase
LNIPLQGDLIIESVIEDETTGNGSKILVENDYTADGVIIIDGTWSERIIYAHLGQIWIDITITGEPVAACVESRGTNPIYIGLELIQSLKELIETFNNHRGETFEGIVRPNFLNVGSYHSGVWHGSVPAEARLEIQIGFSDRFSPEEIISNIREIARQISDRIVVQRSLLHTNAYKSNRDNHLITALKEVIEKNTKKEVLIVPVTGHCDMRHFQTENICLYGPGGGKNAHGIDEHYFLDQMPIVAKNILDFVIVWCNKPKKQIQM